MDAILLTHHFTLGEFTRSDLATRNGIDNNLPQHLVGQAISTCEMLEEIRTLLGDKPIIISSGYRSAKLNDLVGSKPTSDHVQACAVDFTCPAFGNPVEIAKFLSAQENMRQAQIGQLILEFGRRGWVHVSTRLPSSAANRVISCLPGGHFALGITEG